MFTGIIKNTATISEIKRGNETWRFSFNCVLSDPVIGESVAIDGVCVTLISPEHDKFSADVSSETLEVSTLDDYKLGQTVHIERALTATDRFGGHMVLGHVDGLVQVADLREVDGCIECFVEGTPEECRGYLVPKGSVALNGVSLTINRCSENGFSVMLIPHTLQVTTFAGLQKGQLLNIEYDYLAKIVCQQLKLREFSVNE